LPSLSSRASGVIHPSRVHPGQSCKPNPVRRPAEWKANVLGGGAWRAQQLRVPSCHAVRPRTRSEGRRRSAIRQHGDERVPAPMPKPSPLSQPGRSSDVSRSRASYDCRMMERLGLVTMSAAGSACTVRQLSIRVSRERGHTCHQSRHWLGTHARGSDAAPPPPLSGSAAVSCAGRGTG
jgi:hypothetical protein